MVYNDKKKNYMKEYEKRPDRKEKARIRANEYYKKNRQKVIESVKERYQRNKDNPEFMARRRQICRESDLRYIDSVRAKGREYYYQNREKFSERHRNGLLFLGKWIPLDFNPRRGICSQCGRVGFTAIHHIMYDLTNPLAYTIELCVKCHRNEPNQGRGPILKPIEV